MPTTVSRIVPATLTPEGDGMIVRRAFPSQALGRLDPFLVFDEMGPTQIPAGSKSGFPDHPHRGFETVTYILEGSVEHRDSNGNAGRIGPGDVQWMTAGSGVVHSEMPGAVLRRDGGKMHGFQLWVNLPKADKMMAPRYQEIPAAKIPEAKVAGATVRVLAGAFQSTKAVIDTRTPIQYLHVRLEPNATVTVEVPAGQQGFVPCVSGDGTIAGQGITEGQYAMLEGDGELVLAAGADGAQMLVITGVPLKEPVFQWGPFVMTNRVEILKAIQDFESGKFGKIPATITH